MRRLLYLIILASILIPWAVTAQEMRAVWTGTELRVSAPALRFLAGKALERIRHGNTAGFDVQLSITGQPGVVRRSAARFAFSYDLWEERYSVTRLAGDRAQRKSASHLSLEEAQAWCVENIVVSTEGLSADRNVTVQLEIRAEVPQDSAPVVSEGGISLAALIELFSRPARPQQARWNLQQGPLRLNDIRQK